MSHRILQGRGWLPFCAFCAFLRLFSPSTLPAQDLEPGHVRIRSSLSAQSAFVGQRVDLTVEVMTRTWFLSAPAFPDTLDVEGAVVLRPDTFGVNSTERIDGQTFAVQARTFAIFPVSPGELVIPEFAVTLVVARDDASRSDPVTLTSESQHLVAELPEAARGLGLVPATSELEVIQTWSPAASEWKVGDAVTRTITQRIESSVAMVLSAPSDAAPSGVAVYPGRAELDNETDRGALRGSRKDTITYVFEEEGTFVIPDLEVYWWDLENGRLQQENLPGLKIDVLANSDLAAEHLAAPQDEVEEVAAPSEQKREIPWKTMLGGAVLLAGLWLIRRWVLKVLRLVGGFLHREPSAEAMAWRSLRTSLGSADAAEVLAALYSWLDRATGSTVTTWRDAVVRAGIEDVSAFEALEIAALGDASEWSRPQVRRSVATLRRRIVGTGSRQGRDCGLEALNPGARRRPFQ